MDLKPDLKAAAAFLELLTDEFSPKVTFQTFDDNTKKDQALAQVRHGTLEKLGPWLTAMNAKGAGIFVTVNQTDGHGRKKSNITAIRACYTDNDGVDEPPEHEDPKPSIIVDTPHGFHSYWPVKTDSGMTNAECEAVNKALAAKYGGDKAVTDCARVLRVPGFWHQKGEPQMIKMIVCEDRRNEREELLAVIPKEPPKRERQPPKSTAGRSNYGQSALERECAEVAASGEGNRNNQLNESAFSLGQLVAGGELDAGDARRALIDAGLAAGLGKSEVEQTVASGLRAGGEQPRSAPRRGHLELASAGGAVPMPDDADAPEGGERPPRIDPSEPWRASLRYIHVGSGKNAYDKLARDAGNAALLLTNSSALRGCLGYDEFSHQARWLKALPKIEGLKVPSGTLADDHVVYVQQLLALTEELPLGRDATCAAIDTAAKNNPYHPVREYLEQLQWDGHKRIHNWLTTYLGAEENIDNERIGRWWLISAVARIFLPGCQADHVLILEGIQGLGKSSAVRSLADEWYQGSLGDIRDKDGPQTLQGHWLVEIGELDALKGMAATRIKDFLTQVEDVYRPSYGRYTVHRPRQCVFCGTTNDAKYLQDYTGGRRFWPVACTKADRRALEQDRDQIWAEAVKAFKAGDRWWPKGEDEVQRLAEIQEERYEADPWEETIINFANRNPGAELSSDELLDHIGLPRERWDKRHQMRVSSVMRRLGWKSERIRDGGKWIRRFTPPRPVEEEQELPF